MTAALVAVGLLLASCGSASTPAPATAVAPAAAGPVAGASPAGESPEASLSGAASAEASTSESGGNGYDKNRTVALKMSFRVANLYTADGAAAGPALEVWVGSRTAGGKKLVDVPYGAVSSLVPAEMMDPFGQGIPAEGARLDLTFYAAGAAADAAPVFSKAEDAQDGLALTFVVGPSTSQGSGASGRALADAVGAAPKSGGFASATVPAGTGGQAVVLIDALAMASEKAGQAAPGLVASTTDGKCLPYFDGDTAGSGVGNHLHDMNSDVVDLIGGTSYRVFPVSPGAQVQIHQFGGSERVTATCRATPALTFDPKLAAGKRAYAFVYGPGPAEAKVLVVPLD